MSLHPTTTTTTTKGIIIQNHRWKWSTKMTCFM